MPASQMNTSEENECKDGLPSLHCTYKRSIHICKIWGESRQNQNVLVLSLNVAGVVIKKKTDGGREEVVLL